MQNGATGTEGSYKYGNFPLTVRMFDGMKQFNGKIAIVISGDDLTAAEFQDMVKGSEFWKKLIHSKEVEYFILPKANHTFSKKVWRDEVAEYSLQWVLRLPEDTNLSK